MENIKVWCLHCEIVTLFKGKIQNKFPNNYKCSNCGAGCMDVDFVEYGFFRQAYPNIEYDDIKVNKYYPLYP